MSASLELLVKRCEAAGLKVKPYTPTPQLELDDPEDQEKPKGGLVVQIPQERDSRSIIVLDDEELPKVLESKFEHCRFIQSYEAIWSTELRFVEAELKGTELFGGSTMMNRRIARLFGDQGTDNGNPKTYEFPTPQEGVRILMGGSSIEFTILSSFQRSSFSRGSMYPRSTIRIEGVSISTHDEARSILLRVANSVLFQLDLVTNIPIHLAMDRGLLRELRIRRSAKTSLELQAPKYEYDSEAMSLYWYARTATNMPLLQFLAYYQILEFYFPHYAYREAQNRVRTLFKDPTFDINKDRDAAKLLSAITTSARGKSFGDERSQLRATLLGSVEQDQLREWMEEAPERKDFFDSQKKVKSLVKQRVSFTNPENDIRIEVAARIYDLRCRIVHTKEDHETELLLPFTSELVHLKFDLELVEYLARRAMIAGGRQLSI